ncbi:MAG: hypothetical protein LUE64_02265, partial [Candidatus Gastranaerophilales bacterium]|nr:hypothetical protein [Candidatus Gastranaerophilales bacterium]
QLAIYENGTIDSWDLTGSDSGTLHDAASAEKFADYIKPYLNIMTDCGTDSDECIIDIGYKYLNGSNTSTSDINNINTKSDLYKIILADGSLVWFRTNGNGCTNMGGNEENICAIFYYDINGSTEPNQLGRDLFHFKAKYDRLIPCSEDDCYLNNQGFSCAKYIIEHGNLNYPQTR